MINAHWYNRNEGRPYPVDDASSSVSDAGVRLPPGVLVDANLRWPEALGKYAFLSAVSVTPGLVTITVQASDDPDASSGLTPLAVLSVRQPVDQGRMYAVKPQSPGVGGWVAFGSGTEQSYAGRFSTPAQSRLTARAARAYRNLPIESLQALNAAERLTGVVTLKADNPLVLSKEEREIEGVLRDCLVVRLADNNGAEGFPVPGDAAKISGYKQKSVFQEFAGPCAGRPEASTCGCPEPIQFVSAVPPDCNGLLTIEFAGCAELTLIDGCGVAVDCGVGLVDACLPPRIPDENGLLPSEREPANIPVPPPVSPPPPPGPNVEPTVPFVGLPAVNCFTAPGDVELDVVAGMWEWDEDDAPTTPCNEAIAVSASLSGGVSASLSQIHSGSYETVSAANRCVAVWSLGDPTATNRKITTEAKMLEGPAGVKHNAGIALNYRESESVAGVFVYHVVSFDYDDQVVRISWFNGSVFTVLAEANAVGLQLNEWYRITATVVPGPVDGATTIIAQLTSVLGGLFDVNLAVDVTTYLPSTGTFGLCTNRALSRFGYIQIEES